MTFIESRRQPCFSIRLNDAKPQTDCRLRRRRWLVGYVNWRRRWLVGYVNRQHQIDAHDYWSCVHNENMNRSSSLLQTEHAAHAGQLIDIERYCKFNFMARSLFRRWSRPHIKQWWRSIICLGRVAQRETTNPVHRPVIGFRLGQTWLCLLPRSDGLWPDKPTRSAVRNLTYKEHCDVIIDDLIQAG
jgi:hypothetical protein